MRRIPRRRARILSALATLAALVALPATVFAVVYLSKGRTGPRGEAYINLCTLLASILLFWESMVLARLPYVRSDDEASKKPPPPTISASPATTREDPHD